MTLVFSVEVEKLKHLTLTCHRCGLIQPSFCVRLLFQAVKHFHISCRAKINREDFFLFDKRVSPFFPDYIWKKIDFPELLHSADGGKTDVSSNHLTVHFFEDDFSYDSLRKTIWQVSTFIQKSMCSVICSPMACLLVLTNKPEGC